MCVSPWKVWKTVLLFKDSSAVFLTKWLTVLAARVSQKMFIRHLGKRARVDGKEGGVGCSENGP